MKAKTTVRSNRSNHQTAIAKLEKIAREHRRDIFGNLPLDDAGFEAILYAERRANLVRAVEGGELFVMWFDGGVERVTLKESALLVADWSEDPDITTMTSDVYSDWLRSLVGMKRTVTLVAIERN